MPIKKIFNPDNPIPEFEDLKEYLIAEKNAKLGSSGKQIIIRCPWCGDSKDARNAHLYIGPNKRGDGSIAYHCFLCGRGGTVNYDFFRNIQCYDINLINEIITYNARVSRGKYYDVLVTNDGVEHYSPIIRNMYPDSAELAFAKLEYINKRLGTNLFFNDLDRLKIILSINRYIRDNHIQGSTRKMDILSTLDHNYMGFLSIDNTHIVERAIVDDTTHVSDLIKRRYINYCLMPRKFHRFLYYAIPASIDMSKPITIHLAEGPFDVLGIYFNVIGVENSANHIFIASCGKTAFEGALHYLFVFLAIPACMCTLHFYIDRESDGSYNVENYRSFIRYMKTLVIDVKVHVNMFPGEKDYGVTRDKIIDTIIE